MADIRELLPDPEEAYRTSYSGLLRDVWTAMPVTVTQDTTDGHVTTIQPLIKRQVFDPSTGTSSFEDHPVHTEVPITHMGGGGVSHTFPNKQGDEGKVVYAARALDTWLQSGGSQQPIDNRSHDLGDGMYISGIRSIPRMLQQFSKDSSQIRSDDKKHVIDHHPTDGTKIKNVDPSTAPASMTFDPYSDAEKYFEHLVHPTNGIAGNATDGGVTHSHGVTHDSGAFMLAQNALHSVLADPTNGASMNANNLEHSVKAHPDLGSLLSAAFGDHLVQAHPTEGVILKSAVAIAMSAPSLSLPSGSVGGGSLASGAASSNVGALGGDLAGTLPDPTVVGITHVANANMLPNAANDGAAAALGVAVGFLYRNGSVLMVRVA